MKRQDSYIRIRLSTALKKRIEGLAVENGYGMSAFLRKLMVKDLEKNNR